MKIETNDHFHGTGQTVTLEADFVTVIIDDFGNQGIVVKVLTKDRQIKLDSIEVNRTEMEFCITDMWAGT